MTRPSKSYLSLFPRILGRLDYAVNCAAIVGKFGRIDELELEELDKVININLRSQMVMNRFQAKAMLVPKDPLPSIYENDADVSEEEKAARRAEAASFKGSIVNLASIAGFRGGGGLTPAYSISKHAIIGLTRVMAATFGPQGIRTNAIAPGLIMTPMTMEISPEDLAIMDPNRLATITPLRRAGRPLEVAEMALHLCSEKSSYVNGEIITIDGGLTIR